MLRNLRTSSGHLERLRLEPQRASSIRERALPPRVFPGARRDRAENESLCCAWLARGGRGESIGQRLAFATPNKSYPKPLPLLCTSPLLHYCAAKAKEVSAAALAPSTTARTLRTEGVGRLSPRVYSGKKHTAFKTTEEGAATREDRSLGYQNHGRPDEDGGTAPACR